MEAGEIVKITMQQADQKIKSRPGILLKEVSPFNDWLICGISSKLHTLNKELDIVLDKEHSDFQQTNLLYPAIIRVGYLATFPEAMIEGVVGSISQKTLKQLKQNLVTFLS